MKIGQLARAAQTSERLLRHYEAQGLLQASRLPNGYRDYHPDAVKQVRWIRDLIDCGFSTRQIQGFLHCFGQEHVDAVQCAAGLAQHREKLRELDDVISVLSERRTRLAARMDQLFGAHIDEAKEIPWKEESY
ncbi:MerR family transcriptional regulator [Pseudoduganella sp. UC29_106]|uniref:MerR family transcriptional regulator n=1 Tax=Pseudoduganella sp. UC29_106 TaxID=3374553 RepID=UPI003756FC4C